MATIRKRKLPSGKRVFELSYGSREKRRRMLFDTEIDARAALNIYDQQRAAEGRNPEDPEIEKVIARFEEHLNADRRPSTTRRLMRVIRTLQLFLSSFHGHVRSLQDIKESHLEDYKIKRMAGQIIEEDSEGDKKRENLLRQELKKNPKSGTPQANARYGWLGRKRLHAQVSKRTINYELRTLAAFFNWAQRKNLTLFNPAARVEKYRLPKKALPKFMTIQTLRRFFIATNEYERRVFGTMVLTGMRRGETVYLTWSDISFELSAIFIQSKPGIWDPKTDERIIPISTIVEIILREQWTNRRSDRWVFPNKAGQPDKHLLEKMKKICRRAGIPPANLHQLRHSFATHLRMQGTSLADIGELLGHRNLETTQIYARIQQEQLRNAVDRLGKAIPLSLEIDMPNESAEHPKIQKQ